MAASLPPRRASERGASDDRVTLGSQSKFRSVRERPARNHDWLVNGAARLLGKRLLTN